MLSTLAAAIALAELEAQLPLAEPELLRERLAQMDLKPLQDAALHLRAAQLAESLEDLERAVKEYNLALRDEPGHTQVLRRLGQLRADQGDWTRAAKCFQHLAMAAPEDASAYAEWGASLEAAALMEQAQTVYQQGFDQTGDPRLAVALKRLRSLEPPREAPRERESGQGQPPSGLTDAAIVLFATRFAGREGVYARQWVAQGGKSGYSPVDEPFTPAIARLHLSGAMTIGVYPVRSDDTTPFLAFDLDIAKFAMSTPEATQAWPRLMKQVHRQAVEIVERLAELGIPCLLEDSGQKGRHVWVFFETPVPATAARRLARLVLDTIPPPASEIGIEVFPKQARVGTSGYGNLIKLPLGIHRRTGRWSMWLDEAGNPLPDGLRILHEHPCLSRQNLLAVLAQHAVPEVQSAAPPDLGEKPGGTGRLDALASEEKAPVHPDHEEEFLWLRRGCAVLDAIARRADNEHTLTPSERAVMTYTVGHLGQGPALVNHYLSQTYNVEPGEFLKTRLSGHPMSCPKIRSRVPEVAGAVGCACRFDGVDAPYPTPLLHLRRLRQRGTLGSDAVQLTGLELERLVLELIRVRGDISRSLALADRLETRIRAAMQEQAIDTIRTPAGELVRDADGSLKLTVARPEQP